MPRLYVRGVLELSQTVLKNGATSTWVPKRVAFAAIFVSAPPGAGRRAKHRVIPSCAGVKPRLQQYSTLPKFGNDVCVVHPGSPRGAILCR
ncbi:hypothetical protein, partial [Bradyrhizobium japonicum]|uniref:hypothetical protein n=1 Tax=Bradyrhizobium japonicum TaxID=375 RepID=UPI001AEBAC4F